MNPYFNLFIEIPVLMLIGVVSGYVCSGVLYPLKQRYNGDPVAILPVFMLLCFWIVGTVTMLYKLVLPNAVPFSGDGVLIMTALTAMVAAYLPGVGLGVLKPAVNY